MASHEPPQPAGEGAKQEAVDTSVVVDEAEGVVGRAVVTPVEGGGGSSSNASSPHSSARRIRRAELGLERSTSDQTLPEVGRSAAAGSSHSRNARHRQPQARPEARRARSPPPSMHRSPSPSSAPASGSAVQRTEEEEMRDRYRSPYNYPPEAAVVTATEGRVVMGVPVNPVARGDGAGSDDAMSAAGADGPMPLPVMRLHRANLRVPEMSQAEEENLVAVYRLSTSLRPSAVIELVLTAVFAVAWIYFLVLIPFPAVIYAGIRHALAKLILVVSAIFFPLLIALRGYVAYRYSRDDADTEEPGRTVIVIVCVVVILTDVYIAVNLIRLAYFMRKLTPDVRQKLISGWTPTHTTAQPAGAVGGAYEVADADDGAAAGASSSPEPEGGTGSTPSPTAVAASPADGRMHAAIGVSAGDS